MRLLKVGLVASCFWTAAAWAMPGDLDTSFGTGGFLRLDTLGPGGIYAERFAELPNGDILLAWGKSLAVLSPTGTFRTGFGTNGIASAAIDASVSLLTLSVLPDGRILTYLTYPDSMSGTGVRHRVARFLSDGSPDAAFGTDGTVVVERGDYLVALGDGRFFTFYMRTNSMQVTRYTSAGARDNSFNDPTYTLTLPSSTGAQALYDVCLLPEDRGFLVSAFQKAFSVEFPITSNSPSSVTVTAVPSSSSTNGGCTLSNYSGYVAFDVVSPPRKQAGQFFFPWQSADGSRALSSRTNSALSGDDVYAGAMSASALFTSTRRLLVLARYAASRQPADETAVLMAFDEALSPDSSLTGSLPYVFLDPAAGQDRPLNLIQLQDQRIAVLIRNFGSNSIWLAMLSGAFSVPDTSPEPISFATKSNVTPNSQVQSSPATLSGVSNPVVAVADTGMVCINAACGAAPAFASAGDQIAAAHQASSLSNSSVTTTLSIGDTTASFTSVTSAASGGGGGGGGAMTFDFLAFALLLLRVRRAALVARPFLN